MEGDLEEEQDEFLTLSSSQKVTDSCGSRLMECKTVRMCVCSSITANTDFNSMGMRGHGRE